MLNKVTVFNVETDVDTTKEAETNENVLQGSIDGWVTRAEKESKGVNDVFKESAEGISDGEKLYSL